MQSFLSTIADQLLAEFGNDMSKVYVVFPNRRAGRFLRKELVAMAKTTILAPKTTSIEDFVREMSGLDIIDPNSLTLRFFEVYKQLSKADDTTLKQFLRWAPTFLSDIDEADLELMDAEALFSNLHSAKRIESWELGEDGLTEFQQRHLDHVAKFNAYYNAIHEDLSKSGMAYRGMAYRMLADMLEAEGLPKNVRQVWFVGFNALYKAEERIISSLVNAGVGRVVFDVDPAYLNDPMDQAGKFLRQYQRDRSLGKGFSEINDQLRSAQREVITVPVPGSVAQVKVAASLLAELSQRADFNPVKTAIVLNDNSLLIPLLSNLPEGDFTYNLTMGFPFRSSAVARFVDSWLSYQIYAERSSSSVHHRIVDRLVKQPITRLLLGSINDIEKRIGSRVYVPIKELSGESEESERQLIFSALKNPKDLLARLAVFLERSGDADLSSEILGVEEFAAPMEGIILDLKRFFAESAGSMGLQELQMLWNQLKRQTQVPFEGEPLEGVQIMGMLETRVLDFETVIMLGTNEGSLPGNSDRPSYIPFDIRSQMGMRTNLDQDAVTSYHFQRLMQRCEKAYLIYDSDADSPSKGEASRFITQLRMEPWEHTKVESFLVAAPEMKASESEDIEIGKGEFELNALAQYFAKGISPSGFNMYLTCPLKFYYRYVLRLGELDELNESMDHAQFGTVVHDALEELYRPFMEEEMTVSALNTQLSKAEKAIHAEFMKTMEHLGEVAGRDLLSIKVAQGYVEKVIQLDIKYLQKHGSGSLELMDVEVDGGVRLPISLPGPFTEVKLSGRIDRVDRLVDGTIRVLDYKTGKVEARDLKLDTPNDIIENSKKAKAAQLAIYGLMMSGKYGDSERFQFAISSLRMSAEPLLLSLAKSTEFSIVDVESEFKNVVMGVVAEMADQNTSFTQTEDLDSCKYCQYASICNR